MCAIAGLLAFGGAGVDMDALARMSAAMRHRGPDGHALQSFGRCALAHERLAIVDIAGGRQPLQSEDGRTAAVVNGEIYNHQELRRALEGRGHRFATQSDSEVVVHGYEEYGCGIFGRLRGMFAVAIWDGARQTLVLARDGLGKKPLAYTWINDAHFAFASEVRAFHALPGFQPRLRPGAVAEFLGYRTVDDPGSIYESVAKVPAGECLRIRPDGTTERSVHWVLPSGDSAAVYDPRLEQSLSQEIRDRVGTAVQRRLMSDVPVGVLLSGGIDSTIVAYEAARLSPGIRTFTLGFTGANDECDVARQTAKALGTRHADLRIALDPRTAIEEAEAAYDEPFADSSSVATVRLCRAAREHVSVVLNGDGGDEAFAGYPRARLLAERWRHARSWWMTRLLETKFRFGRPRSRAEARDSLRIRKAIVEHSDDFQRWRALRWTFSPQEVRRMTGVECESGGQGPWTFADSEADDYLSFLRNDLLVKMDRASMHVGLEARSPLLDTDFIALARRLDAGWKLRGGQTKYLLRRAYAGLLPSHIWSLKKRGFASPTRKWLRTVLAQDVEDLQQDRRQPIYAVLDHAAVQWAIGNQHGMAHEKLWTLLTLNRWLTRESARIRI